MGSGKPEFMSNKYFVQSGFMPTRESESPQRSARNSSHISSLIPGTVPYLDRSLGANGFSAKDTSASYQKI